MAHDVFISHSSRDKPVADAVCFALETGGVRCWIAPRDVQPGRSYSGEITRAIKGCRVMVLVFSSHSNDSHSVLSEVEIAHEARAHIINFRVEDAGASDDLHYYLRRLHWLDALTPPMERYHAQLLASVRSLLSLGPGAPPPSTPPQATPTRPPVQGRPAEPSPTSFVPDAAPARHELVLAYLHTALKLSVHVGDAGFKSGLQNMIAAAQVRAGDLAAAMRTVRSKEKASSDEDALGYIAEAQAQSGHVSDALATAARLTELHPCGIAQQGIAAAQARAGDLDAALRTAMAIKHEGYQTGAIGDIAVAQARVGDLVAALQMLRRIRNVAHLGMACVKVVAMQAQTGNFASASRLVESISDDISRDKARASVAIAQARFGDIPSALSAVAGCECFEFKAAILEAVALTQARGGDFAGALHTVAEIPRTVVGIDDDDDPNFDPDFPARSLGRIAALQILQGEAAGAEKTLESLELGYPRVLGYVELAKQLLDKAPAETR